MLLLESDEKLYIPFETPNTCKILFETAFSEMNSKKRFMCEDCGHNFVSKFSLDRHAFSKHNLVNEETEDNESERNDSASENEENESERNDEDCVSENDDNQSNESSRTDLTNNEDDPFRSEFWTYIIKGAYSTLDEFPENFSDVITGEAFTEMLAEIRNRYEIFLKVKEAYECDEIAKKLEKTIEYFQYKLDYEKDEAEENAWDSRKYLFKKLLTKNEDLYNEEYEERTTGDEEIVDGEVEDEDQTSY